MVTSRVQLLLITVLKRLLCLSGMFCTTLQISHFLSYPLKTSRTTLFALVENGSQSELSFTIIDKELWRIVAFFRKTALGGMHLVQISLSLT